MKINLINRNLHKYFVFDENKKWSYFDIFRKNFYDILCFATCDWFCPMTSHISKIFTFSYELTELKARSQFTSRNLVFVIYGIFIHALRHVLFLIMSSPKFSCKIKAVYHLMTPLNLNLLLDGYKIDLVMLWLLNLINLHPTILAVLHLIRLQCSVVLDKLKVFIKCKPKGIYSNPSQIVHLSFKSQKRTTSL